MQLVINHRANFTAALSSKFLLRFLHQDDDQCTLCGLIGPAIFNIYKMRIAPNTYHNRILMYQLLMSVLNCALWVFFGANIPHPKMSMIICINCVGIVLGTCMLLIFYRYTTTPRNRTIIKVFYILGASFVAILVRLSFVLYDTKRERSEFIGVLCASVSVITFGVPLDNIFIVQPAWANSIIVLNGSVWFWYAILDEDVYTEVGSLIGVFFGLIQLGFSAIYPTEEISKIAESVFERNQVVG